MHPTTNPTRWSFYLLWILAPLLAIPLAFVIDLALIRLITWVVGDSIVVNGVRHITEDYVGVLLFLPLAGLIIGSMQAILLRHILPHVAWWIVATLGGWLLGAILAEVLRWLPWSYALSMGDAILLVMGIAIGGCQWLVLRRQVRHAGWWIGATTVGWALVALVNNSPAFGLRDLISLGVLPATATALLLAFGMRHMHSTLREGTPSG